MTTWWVDNPPAGGSYHTGLRIQHTRSAAWWTAYAVAVTPSLLAPHRPTWLRTSGALAPYWLFPLSLDGHRRQDQACRGMWNVVAHLLTPCGSQATILPWPGVLFIDEYESLA